ncbi:MAG: ATP-dependent DNA ligase [Phycisphaerales bacterium]
MRRFTRLYDELDATTRTSEKIAALERYFREAAPADAAWALAVLTGGRIKRAVNSRTMRELLAEVTKLPDWLIGECYSSVGDLSETIALLAPTNPAGTEAPLHEIIEHRLLELPGADDSRKREILRAAWTELSERQLFVFHKLLSGSFRVGAQKRLVARALASIAGVDPPVMAARLTGRFDPTPAAFERLLSDETESDDRARPYPFFLAHQLDDPPESLGPYELWRAEWKWDGTRAQLLRRGEEVTLWSRGEEIVTHQFPEVAAAAQELAEDVALDGEILIWGIDRPRPFADLQKRLGRKVAPTAQLSLFSDERAVFMAYDLLELAGVDWRPRPFDERRAALESLLDELGDSSDIRLSPMIDAASWAELGKRRDAARTEMNAEGVMLKRGDLPYGVGRVKIAAESDSGADAGALQGWWKWKVDPYEVDAVLVHAQPGSGRRSGLYTDYTFAVWGDATGADQKRPLVPFCKAYSGLTNAEIEEVDAFVRRNTTARNGPVRTVEPRLVFEIAFESIQRSKRHKSGVAVRFPRIARWRRDKPIEEADTMDTLRGLLKMTERLGDG